MFFPLAHDKLYHKKCEPLATFDIPAVKRQSAAALNVPEVVPGKNLLVNSSFDDPAMKEWTSRKKARKVIHEVKDGKLLLSGDVNNKYRKNLTITQNVPVKLAPGRRYRLAVDAVSRVSNPGDKRATVQIRAIGSSGQSIRYYGFEIDLTKSGSQTVTYIYTPPANAVDHQIYIDWMNFGDDDILELDNLTLTPVN